MATRTAVARRRSMTTARRTEIRIASLQRRLAFYQRESELDLGEEKAIRATWGRKGSTYTDAPESLIDAFVKFRKVTPTWPMFVLNNDHQAQALVMLASTLKPHSEHISRAQWILVGMDTRIKKWMDEGWTFVPVEFVGMRNSLKVFLKELEKAAKGAK